MIEWLPAAALIGMTAWFSMRAAVERAESITQQIQHEQFWGDGKTADGSWAEALQGQGVSNTGGVVASYEDRQAIRPDEVEPHSHRAQPTPCAALTPPEDVGL
jgi:hypothetical protein